MNIGPRLLALLTCLTGTVAFGQQPPIVFQENFDEPGWPDAEKWGETSAVLRGTQNETQAARVVNENSAEFGFDGNYLQLFKETTASASVWVVAQNKIPGSEVMTAEFDYRRMGPASDGP